MKNLFSFSILMLAFISQISAYNAPKTATLSVIEDQKAVILNLSEIDATSFVLFDKNGTRVYSQEIEKFDTGVKYVMNYLPTGPYNIEIHGDNFVEVYHAIITKDAIEIESSEAHFRPSISATNNKVVVDAELAEKEDVEVSIFDKKGYLVYSFNDHKTGNYNRVFDLNKLKKGQYSVVVSTDYFTESSTISL